MRVHVEVDTIVAINPVTGVSAYLWRDDDSFQTIPGYFDFILTLIEEDYRSDANLKVEYDPEFGYPSSIVWVDRRKSDSDFRIEISNYVPSKDIE